MTINETPQAAVNRLITDNRVMVFSKSYCPYCKTVKELFGSLDIGYRSVELNEMGETGSSIQAELGRLTGQSTVPNVFINGNHVGGSDSILALHSQSKLLARIGSAGGKENAIADNASAVAYEYDLLVLGGGSGGLASSKEAAKLGMKVGVFDYIVPTPLGTTWGLGGTCVNVGCIPKKLMHQAALLGEDVRDSMHFGFSNTGPNVPHSTSETCQSHVTNGTSNGVGQTDHAKGNQDNKVRLNWETLVQAVQAHIQGLNFKYKAALRSQNVKYINAHARFIDPHTIEGKDKRGKVTTYTAKFIIVSTGLRPTYLDIPGSKENCITSDDLFSLPHPPGKTLCVGASYISLECAGFLSGIGYPVTVMVRSILLRGFDREMADIIGSFMERHGIRFIKPAIPTKIEKLVDGTPGLYRVFYERKDGTEVYEDFNTILLAIGREARTDDLNLGCVGANLNPKNKKFITDAEDRTSVNHIYAIGDNADGIPELTPVAVEAGILLARRLFGSRSLQCDYRAVPTTVFTPIEYGACGLSDEEATSIYGTDDIEVWRKSFKPLEWDLAGREKDFCLFKLVVVKSLTNRVIGFHYVGPNAGEVTQGFGLAMKTGKATLEDCQRIISITMSNGLEAKVPSLANKSE